MRLRRARRFRVATIPAAIRFCHGTGFFLPRRVGLRIRWARNGVSPCAVGQHAYPLPGRTPARPPVWSRNSGVSTQPTTHKKEMSTKKTPAKKETPRAKDLNPKKDVKGGAMKLLLKK